jgi:beta-N-acetylhexosaminidase
MAARAAIFGCAGPALGPDEAAFFRDADPWGFILFARNVETPDQLRRLTAALRESVGRDAPILIDQEGGRVQRLGPPCWRGWDDVGTALAALAPETAEEALELRYRLIAAELVAVGIDTDCAPLLDLRLPGADPIIGARALGAEPETVARLAAAVIRGLEAGGVRPVIKHIPGHGRADADSHARLPIVSADRATLDATDFAPFRAHAGAALGMTAHVRFDAIDPARCATLSPEAIRVIREEIGFGGCLMTDDISMGALDGPIGARCDAALAAGCDLILHCNGDRAEMTAVAAATPRLAGSARARAEAAEPRPAAEPFDPAEAERRLAALSGGMAHA